jgi:hypothetical protein
MSLPELVFLTVVLAIGLPSAVYNRTAAALVGSWGMQEVVAIVAGVPPGTVAGLVLDLGVIAVVLCKPEVRDCSPYRTMGKQIAAFWCERSAWDSAILTIFPIMWTVHAMNIDLYYRWWALWWLALVQVLLSGAEALGPPLRRILVVFLTRVTPPPNLMKVAAGHA